MRVLSQVTEMEPTTHTEETWRVPGEPGRHSLLSIVESVEEIEPKVEELKKQLENK